ncbi:MAG: rhodanese-like domain-containing protein [Gammaproteobacteria bacterium]|jgi:rhodanese-related sulfurtransferase
MMIAIPEKFCFTAVFLILLVVPLAAVAEKSPESIKGTTKVTAEGFIELVDTIPELIVIDSRIRGDRKQGYVEGSVSLPDVETTCDTLSDTIPQKSSPTLFYCNGVKCGRSAKAVKVALSCGYTNIYWFRGGFEEWLAKGYPYLQE